MSNFIITRCNICGATVKTHIVKLPIDLYCPICSSISTYHKLIECKTSERFDKLKFLQAVLKSNDEVDPAIIMSEVEKSIEQTMKTFEAAESAIRKRKLNLMNDLVRKYEGLNHFANAFSKLGYMAFMSEPIIGIVPFTDEFSCHCAIIIVPNFIKYELGILIRKTAGYSFYFVTDLTLFTYPVPEEILHDYGFSIRIGELDLKVAGSKIIGSDLISVYKDIPSISYDVDHTEEMPSVVISDKASVFSWLIKNGVMPIKPFGFHFNLASKPDPKEFCETSDELKFVLDFIKYSRVICTGMNYNSFLRIMANIARRSNCFALLITRNADTPRHHGISIIDGSVESISPEVIRQHRIVLIDGDSWLLEDYETIASVQSPMVIYTEDPLFDCLSGNVDAPLIYGLCPIISIASNLEIVRKMEGMNVLLSSSIIKMFDF